MSAARSAQACFTGETGDQADETSLPADDKDSPAEPFLSSRAGERATAAGLRVQAGEGPPLAEAGEGPPLAEAGEGPPLAEAGEGPPLAEADDRPLLGDLNDLRATTRAESRRLFGQLAELDPDDRKRARARDKLTELHLPLAEHLARKFAGRGEPYEDLVQVATIGLIKAIDRYDPGRGVEFSTFAMPTIMGEIKRWFRDKGWAIRVPRRLQELRMTVSSATTDLLQRLGRSPTVTELADAVGVTEDDVLEALETATAYSTLSLDSPEHGDNTPATIETLGHDDDALEGVENRETLNRMLSSLPERERTIIVLRFFRSMTQSQIAREIGISQMHVSRLLSRTLAQLREGMFT